MSQRPPGGKDAPDPQPRTRRGVRSGPEQTRDDTDAGWGEWREESEHERWLQEQRPPHWE
ncbi:hypothetical protein [Gephyromycinifex aptenodytis]|uniref:hypothetical protein n=1 Tax=Gephyromycinifex aptenodytis TaxID=2716227 RepID=UPI001444E860|nr:hypothetical protein [Gephyromycinifex aptenodytis]